MWKVYRRQTSSDVKSSHRLFKVELKFLKVSISTIIEILALNICTYQVSELKFCVTDVEKYSSKVCLTKSSFSQHFPQHRALLWLHLDDTICVYYCTNKKFLWTEMDYFLGKSPSKYIMNQLHFTKPRYFHVTCGKNTWAT